MSIDLRACLSVLVVYQLSMLTPYCIHGFMFVMDGHAVAPLRTV